MKRQFVVKEISLSVASGTTPPLIKLDGRTKFGILRKAGGSLKRPRVLLADDHVPIIERVKPLLETAFEIVGSVDNGKDLVSEAGRLQPDLILLDISMPGLTGIEAAHELRQNGAKAKLVFLTVHERVEFVHACLAEGALGYVVKSRIATDLVTALREALAGRRFISPSVPR
jgi:DNA-binding NarL/FixJ family response regulator